MGASIIDNNKFIEDTDHPSLIKELQRQQRHTAVATGDEGVTLGHCFQKFIKPERLDELNKWYCSNCKEHVRAMKTIELWNVPNILIIQLKRFEYKNATLRREKLGTFVDCPIENLNMGKYCASSSTYDQYHHHHQFNNNIDNNDTVLHAGELSPNTGNDEFVLGDVPAIYDLFAVTNHYGRMGFGHYDALARRWNEEVIDDDWCHFDDSNVKNLGAASKNVPGGGIVTSAAYILFYRRRIFI